MHSVSGGDDESEVIGVEDEDVEGGGGGGEEEGEVRRNKGRHVNNTWTDGGNRPLLMSSLSSANIRQDYSNMNNREFEGVQQQQTNRHAYRDNQFYRVII